MPTNTIGAALTAATAMLDQSSPSPRLDAEVLLGHVTGKNRTHFRAWPEQQLDETVHAQFLELIKQRLSGIPIAYLTGSREFWSLDFLITPDVLIPRPETETLVELALGFLPFGQPGKILDLGTGSGAIAIAIALERPCTDVVAVDVSSQALELAGRNADRLGGTNVSFRRGDWFAALGPDERFDLIVSNPPYVAEHDPHLRQDDVRFEPKPALASGIDGLDDLRKIIGAARSHLNEGGWLLFEHGYDQSKQTEELLRAAGFTKISTHLDLQGQPRVGMGQSACAGTVTLPQPGQK